jgi:hypothetical protein
LLVLFVAGGMDVVVVGKAHQIIDFVFYYANVTACDGIHLVSAMLEEPVLARFNDFRQEFIEESAVMNLRD